MFGNLPIVGWFGDGAGGGGGSVTTITVDLTGNVTGAIDLTGQSGNLIINLITKDLNTNVVSFINDGAVTGIVLRPDTTLNPLTLHDITESPGNIKLNAPTLPVYGGAGGFLQLEKRTIAYLGGSLWCQVDYIDQYAT